MISLDAIRALGQGATLNVAEGHVPRPPVGRSRDLDRVIALPRKGDRGPFYVYVSKFDGEMTLWPEQAEALVQAWLADGLFAAIGVGHGKTLIACLLPTVLQRRAVILTTPGLVRQGQALLEQYRQHFQIRDDLQWLAYSTLSSAKGALSLEHLAPELIVADECHALKDRDSARTKRFLRYMRRHPETLFCAMSGTITKRSLRDFAHLLELALHERSPLPLHFPTLMEWAEAIDPGPGGAPPVRPAGALRLLCREGETAREGWGRHFRESVGVVASTEETLGSNLTIRIVESPVVPEIQEAIAELHKTWERPDGEYLTLATEVAALEHTLRLGGYYRWDWSPGEPEREWIDARRAFNREMAAYLKHHSREGLDSPLLVTRAIERGEITFESWPTWLSAMKRRDPPKTKWEWISDKVIDHFAKRVGWDDTADRTVVWTDTPPVGQALARALHAPYYGEGPRSAEGILTEKGDRTIVASIQAHGTGRNLQAFSRAVVVGGPASGTAWEQLLGRLHRSGQTADEVAFEVFSDFAERLGRAIDDAAYIQETTGTPQKLLMARITAEGADE